MAQYSLYRTYRPRTFSDVQGQSHVTEPLIAQIQTKKHGHAYLFAGSRGLGKTSVARIFAQEVGCHGNDLYEIDAASNNSVDDIRTLTENVYTLPFASPYKVYILDEVHMLSKAAWNAFLKTLEEPPAHAIFILATTELPKVPETVQSRCQVFEFKRPSREALSKVVTQVASKEGYTIAGDASNLIALLAEGSYRDALSILQRVLTAVSHRALSRENVEMITGAPKSSLIYDVISALAQGSAEQAYVAIKAAQKNGTDMKLFLTLLLEALRFVLLLRYAPELKKQLQEELGEDAYTALAIYANEKTPGITHNTLLAFLTAVQRMRFTPIPTLPLELAVLEATNTIN
ncbi:MAG TPA: DNA polymerase III subunit gamma/tau [Candidatus Kaiserbacteria bacterium]|nr:DNA polymerase III subunit gamma/tau [Candidatus Kaiserbacteria bacterium]